jgi:hypothetical protein
VSNGQETLFLQAFKIKLKFFIEKKQDSLWLNNFGSSFTVLLHFTNKLPRYKPERSNLSNFQRELRRER